MKACLVVTVRDEAPYILEWVAYHRAIGFTDIVIFQNDSTDLTHHILRQLQAAGAIAYRYNAAVRGRHQVRAYTRATLLEEYRSSDWVMALDIDEFLHIRAGKGRVGDLVTTAGDAEQILVNWKRFGSGTQTRLKAGLVTRRFVHAEPAAPIATELRPFKTLFRREAFDRPGVHRARRFRDSYKPKAVNGSGLPESEFQLHNFRSSDPGLYAHAQINHYVVRDPQGFVLKSLRGSPHQADREIGEKYWRRNDVCQEFDSGLADLSPLIEAEMDRLDDATDGRLRRLTRKALRQHMQRFAQAMKDPHLKALYGSCRAQQAARLDGQAAALVGEEI